MATRPCKGIVEDVCPNPDCNGGEILVPDPDDPDDLSRVRKEDCPRCKGTGKIRI